jgi:hypothetical protein
MRAFLLACVVALAGACGGKGSAAPIDGRGGGGGGTGGSIGSGGADGGLATCVDTPTELPRPPMGRLPCELIPPGLRL